ncbi:MAG: 50S ribosomal protein L25/general stress protein Ctc [Gemmatimonadetes bacterium]|nr:50S ribosomal protein L25/general stress protein Ctc [Gemmatimonadota bacterium]
MASVPFKASTRSTTGKGVARKLRAAGKVPAVIYGHAREAQSLELEHHALQLLLEKHPYQSTVIALDVDGKTSNTLIREIQRHPFKKQIVHVDFQELVAGEKVTVPVPLQFTGTPDGVRHGGGLLDQILHELEVSCDPSNIPHHIIVDVTPLTIGHSIHAGEIALPAGVTLETEADATVCVCAAPKVEVEAAPAEGAAPSEPELIRKAKAEEEAAEKK